MRLLLTALLAFSSAAAFAQVCALQEVVLVEPFEGSTLFLSRDAASHSIRLLAETDCEDGIEVEFFLQLEGEEEARSVAVDAAAPYEVHIPVQFGLGLDQELLMRAVARTTDEEDDTAVETEAITNLSSTAELDEDNNGLPDAPFEVLDHLGDAWVDGPTLAGAEFQLLSAVNVLYGVAPLKAHGQDEVVVTLRSEENEAQSVTVTASEELVGDGEVGMLIVQAAPNLDSLLGGVGGDQLRPEPRGGFVGEGQYVHIGVVISSDGGATFNNVQSSRLRNHPILLSMAGLTLRADAVYTLAHHPVRVGESDGRMVVEGQSGIWRAGEEATVDVEAGTISAEVTALGVHAPFASVDDGGGEPVDVLEEYGTLIGILVALGILQLTDGGVGGGGPCFIATAAYGSDMAAQLGPLRSFRDEVLLANPLGTAFVDFYYRLSPGIAEVVAEHSLLALSVRIMLAPVLLVLLYPVPTYMGAAAALWAWRSRRMPCLRNRNSRIRKPHLTA